ncbi:phage tail tape measure protein [Staphylococcus condimenti]|uniref:lysostaphin n=1 Tax=Staphylococcus condimenti TaxID=70255 RepID=A0A4Q7CR28_9STAP|nr:phage tail tape measure protein [Staphylococcus condimenti]RZI03037.1 phage tail tape measure protein [Staphylococcus condimenti]
MNEKLQGFTLEMKLDSLGVQEGMKGLKRQLGVVNSEMKANLSAFDKAERSMDQYKTKIDGLNNKMKVQKQMFNQAESELKELNANYAKATSRVKGVEQAYKSLTAANQKNKQALEKSNASLKESNRELKKAETQSNRTNNQREKAAQRLEKLKKAEEELKNSNKATTTQLKRASEAVEKQSQKHKELDERYKKEETQVEKLRGENKKLSDSNEKVKSTYDKTNKELKQTEKEYNDVNKTIKDHNKNLAAAENQVNNEKASLNNLQRAIDKTTNEMKEFNKEQMIANSQYTKTADHMDNMAGKFGTIGSKMTDVGRNMTMGVTTPIVAGLGAAVKTSADFEAQMSRVGAIAQASGGEMKAMSNQAMELGAKTSQSASEVAKGMEELAALGFNANQVMSAMPGVISAAEASGADMATTATVMASSINSFNLKASDSSHVADLLATAANDSAADISYMGEALKYAGTPAKALGVSIEDTSAAIEIMSNAGLDGSTAGTVLRASFIRLANPTGKAAKEIEKMGIHLTDNEGKFVGMGNLVGQFREEMKGMTKEQKLANISTVVGTEAASGFLALIEAGPDKVNQYSDSLKNSDGASKKAADQMKNNLKGALEQLKGAFETLGIQVGKDLTPAIQGAAKGIQGFVEGFSSLPGWVRKGAIGMGLFAAALGPVALGLGLVLRAVGSAAKGYASLNRQMAINTAEAAVNATANKGAAASFATTGKSVKGSTGLFGSFTNTIMKTTGKFGGLGNTLKTGTKIIGKVGVPLTILTTIFGVAYEKMDWFRKGFDNMGKLVKQVGDSMDFSWIDKAKDKMGKFWDDFKNDMAKGLQEGLLFKGIKKGFDGLDKMVSKASDTTDVFAKGVSKGTEKALKSYNKLSKQSTLKLEEIKLHHGKISNEQYQQITNIYKKMGDEISKQLDSRHDKEISGLNKIFRDTNGLTKKQEAKIIAQAQQQNEKESASIQKTQEKIQAIYKKAHDEHRALKKSEIKQIEELQTQLDSKVVKSMSKGEVEQKAILERMKQNKSKLSIQAASNVIKESAKERDKTISDAKKKYKDTVAEAIKQRDQNGTLSKEQADKVIKNAKKQYDESKDKAKKQHKDVVNEAKKQNKGVGANIDSQTGKVKTGWQKMIDTTVVKGAKIWITTKKTWDNISNKIGSATKNGLNSTKKWFGQLPGRVSGWFESTKKHTDDKWNKISSKISSSSRNALNNTKKWFGQLPGKTSSWFKSTKKHTDDNWNKISNKISSSTKSAFNNSRKWLGQLPGKTSSWFKSAKKNTDDNWNKISSKIGSSTRSAYNSAKKWFGNTTANARSNFKNTWNATKDRFGDIANKVENKTHSVFNSGKKWFGKTYGNAKENFKNMWNNTKSRYGDIASKAEAKSKSVFNSGKKWFGKTYGNAKENFQNMKNKATDRFKEIAAQAEEKAKKTFGSWKSWLDKTLGWIKNIKKDFGSAASSLGKEVANKAIGGLNSMIGGINNIAKAITDKTLIKPIPTLSTGTFDGSSLATDSNGGVMAPTMALVNDRGPGNGNGSNGHQELIQRADGSLHAPQGKDVIVKLNKGDGVINGTTTQHMQNIGMIPKFSKGSIPRFAKGSFKKKLDDYLEHPLQSLVKDATKGSQVAKKVVKDKSKNVIEKAKEVGNDAVESAEDMASGIWGGIKGVTKDVGEFLENPAKLVEKVMDKMGINFGGGDNATVKMAKGAYSILKKKLVDKVQSWFDESGGDGAGGWIDLSRGINTPYSPNGPPPGYAFNWPHPGIDLPYRYEPVYSTISGTAHTKEMPGGFGHYIQVHGGDLDVIYGHLSKWLVHEGQRVHPGTKLGISGNTGASTGPHLHYEMHQNGRPIDPIKWLKAHPGKKGGKSSAPREVSAWRPEVMQALRLAGLPANSAYANAWLRQINTESSGNPSATGPGSSEGTPRGLVQVKPGTFNAYKLPGHGNVLNGLDNLIAGMRYAKARYGGRMLSTIGVGGPYANGGMVTKHQIAEIGEGNKPEMVVPLTRRNRAIQLIEQAMQYVGMDRDSTNVTVNNDNSMVEKLLTKIINLNDKNNRLTEAVINVIQKLPKGTDYKSTEKIISQIQGERSAEMAYMRGGTV